ncbi:2'-5' RNA ligase [Methanomicrobium sp. W14]|uniref:hypothetical protein n=1 Tax=Methanomicrobium sp. W14 TaxID=2817839 RepID=UPI001AE2F67B|nr:hypothetical protein [Methanomicrobium sp. W14]MBP2132635.1 2'-5' RNA ligase [Methanomicrobium sp. W14]
MLSETVAVDVILRPPDEITDYAVRINKMLNEMTKDYSLVLGKTTTIPHISLAMGALKVSDLNDFYEELRAIGDKYIPFETLYKGLASVKTSENNTVSGMDLIKTGSFTDLQDEIISAFFSYRTGPVKKEMVYPDREEITGFTLEYSSDYPENSTGENFSPHITLGNGDVYCLKNVPFAPEKFTCKSLAVCHLGNHCTCKKILREYTNSF